MAAGVDFVRFYVLLSNLWASQCEQCGQIVFRQQENELPLAEASHKCLTKKPSANTSGSAGGNNRNPGDSSPPSAAS